MRLLMNGTVFDSDRFATFGANPYETLQELLSDEMYPPFARGFAVRVGVLIGVQVCVVLVACVYIFLLSLDNKRKGRKSWAARVVQRPAGRYLVLNQYMVYPAFAVILACLWLPYTIVIYRIFGGAHCNPDPLFFLIALIWCPFFLHLATCTFAVLGAGNLAQSGSDGPNSHPLGPKTANSIYLVLTPIVLLMITGVGIWTGYEWREFARSWTDAYDALGAAAGSWNGTPAPGVNEMIAQLLETRLVHYFDFEKSQHVCTIVFCVSAAVLSVINVVGGVYLLSSLRSLTRREPIGGAVHTVLRAKHEPVVAPLAPFKSSEDSGSPLDEKDMEHLSNPTELRSDGTDKSKRPASTGRLGLFRTRSKRTRQDETSSLSGYEFESGAPLCGPSTTKLKRLEWDVMLFFLSVVPSCIIFMGLSIYITDNLLHVLRTPRLYELWLLGVPFIYSAATLLSLLALALKTSCTLIRASRLRALPQHQSQHHQYNQHLPSAMSSSGRPGSVGVGMRAGGSGGRLVGEGLESTFGPFGIPVEESGSEAASLTSHRILYDGTRRNSGVRVTVEWESVADEDQDLDEDGARVRRVGKASAAQIGQNDRSLSSTSRRSSSSSSSHGSERPRDSTIVVVNADAVPPPPSTNAL